jgi:hypothetical protein
VSYDASQVCFIDCETGGLDPERHQIWEVAVIVDGEEHVWQQKLASGLNASVRLGLVDEWVLENTGIRDRYDHDTALEVTDSYERWWTLTHGRHIVGACPWFDSERLHRLGLFLDRLGGPFGRDLAHHYHLIDVENLAVGFLAGATSYGDGGTENWGLGVWDQLPWRSTDLSLALGVDPADFEPKHSALADARWAKALYEAIMGPPR